MRSLKVKVNFKKIFFKYPMKKNLQEAYRKFIKKFYRKVTEICYRKFTGKCNFLYTFHIIFTERHDKFTKNYMRLYRKDIDIITSVL